MATSTNAKGKSPFTRALLAGALAGTTVDLSLHPIDTLKTRLQSPTGFASAGGFRGIYAGVGSALVGSAPGAALFFVTYETAKRWLLAHKNTGSGSRGGAWTDPLAHMAAASVGEVAACAVRVPTEVVKQRAQAVQYASSGAALRAIFAQRGNVGWVGVRRELYRGWGVMVLREVPFTVIQFPLWEGLKAWRGRRRGTGREGTIGAVESGVCGSVAGAIAAGVTTPLDVLKTRMMLARGREGVWEMARRVAREGGGRAFFKGVGPRVVWISVGGAVFLGSYQWAYNALEGV